MARIFLGIRSWRWDASTGKYKWHFQVVHHDLWDFGFASGARFGGHRQRREEKIPALVQIGKSGYMFILDRVTGKPVFGVDVSGLCPRATFPVSGIRQRSRFR